MQKIRKLLSHVLVLGVVTHVFIAGLIIAARPAQAALLAGSKDTLTDPRAGQSSTHTFQFTVPTSTTLMEIRFQFATTSTGSSVPSGLDLSSATLGTLVNMNAGWTINTADSGSGILKVQHTNSGQNLGSTVVTIPFQAITNSSISACDGTASSDTCFVQIQSSSAIGAWDASVVDETTTTYTVIQAVTVSATVDPSFTFVITSVGASTVVGGVTTSVASTVTTLPFSNLTAGTTKYAAHGLNVTTNAQSGYSVTMAMITQMAGTYSGNNIDAFGASGASWSSPIPWTSPTGTAANTNTGWIGAYTSDADLSQFDAGEFGPVNSTSNAVMSSTTSDNGSTRIYVNYAIEVNVYQPADVYTGTLVYTATPTY